MAVIKDLRWMIPEAFPGTQIREVLGKGKVINHLTFLLPNKLDVAVGFYYGAYWSGRDSWEETCIDYLDRDEDFGKPEYLLDIAYTAELSILAPHAHYLQNHKRGWRDAEGVMETIEWVINHPEACEWLDYRQFMVNSRKRIERYEEHDDMLFGYTLGDWRRIR